MESTQSSAFDPVGSLMIIILSILGLLYLLLDDFVQITEYLTIGLGIITVLLYYFRINNLPLSSRTPLSDAIVVLGGIVVILHLLGLVVDMNALSVLSPYLGLYMIIGAIVAKLLLIDQVLERFLVELIQGMQRITSWIFSSLYNATRLLSFVLGITVIVLHYSNLVEIPYVDVIAVAFLSLPLLLMLVVDRNAELRLVEKVVGIIISLVLFALIIGSRDQVSLLYLIPVSLYFLWSISVGKLFRSILSLLRALGRFFRSLYYATIELLGSVFSAIQAHPLTSLRITLLVLAIPAYIFAPAGQILGLEYQLLFPLTLILLAALPSIISFSQTFFPQFYRGIVGFGRWLYQSVIGLFQWFSRLVRNVDLMLTIGGFAGFISLFFIQDESAYLQIGVASLSTLLLSFAGHSFLMRFYDAIFYGFARLINGFIRVVRMIIPRLEKGLIISFLAWVLLILGIFYPLFFSTSPIRNIRAILIIGSIFVWNSAYEHRRKRFYGFLNSLFGGIWRRIRNLVEWVFRNVFIVLLWIIGIGFFVLSFGLIFPGTIGFVSDIFSQSMDNALVRWIIALSLAGIGSLTLQQSVARRAQLQRSSEVRK